MFGITANYLSCSFPLFATQKLLELQGIAAPIFPVWFVPNFLQLSPETASLAQHNAELVSQQIKNRPSLLINPFGRLIDVMPVLIDALPDIIFVKDGAGHWLVANAAAKQLFQLDNRDWQGKTSRELFAQPLLGKCLGDNEMVWQEGKPRIFEEPLSDNGQQITNYQIQQLPLFKANGERNVLITICRDVNACQVATGALHNAAIAIESYLSEHRDAEEAIRHLAFYDPLTDLPNRRLLNDRLQQALVCSNYSRQYGAVLLIDLDHFKTINDSKGHDVGDALLIQVAHRLLSCVRQNDTVARLGGDEFIILLEALSVKADQAVVSAETVAEKVLRVINQPYILAGHELYSSPSIGICLFNGDNTHRSANEILKCADAAMYQAKSAGRNTLRFFDPVMQVILENRATLKSELHHALIKNQFKLYYQIQINSAGIVFGAEALIRWQHPERGLIFPGEFISLAEESGLILPIGDWVLHTACLQLKHWENNPLTKDLVLAVNVSPLQFRQAKFVEQLSQLLMRTTVNPAYLKLELTESMVITDIGDTVKKMQQLQQLGISFSMDDFGTGYSSLSCLKKLPFGQLKIDQSFVRDIVSDPCDAAIVETILGMARTLGLNVIAEGVENEKQYASLESRGCPAYQGYLFGKAMPVNEFEQLILQITQLQQVPDKQDWYNVTPLNINI